MAAERTTLSRRAAAFAVRCPRAVASVRLLSAVRFSFGQNPRRHNTDECFDTRNGVSPGLTAAFVAAPLAGRREFPDVAAPLPRGVRLSGWAGRPRPGGTR
ncbi:hypothetical protein [Streptomyces sp. TRM49041]|uniref:hypothetical protein n=1 Tax=Streptomyces sp. TRM49041 TaxID=2603216 RepID=UPI0011EEC094|nr:hypothetical protein [Streptomyces sp. TRM49041]